MRSDGKRGPVAPSVGRGALAGALGSSSMLVALRAENALVPRRDRMAPPWVKLTDAVLDRSGIELSPRATHVVGTFLHLGYGAFAGAAYAVIDRRVFRRHPWANAFVVAGVLYATGYLRGGLQHSAGALAPPSRQRPPRAFIPIGLHVVFASTMAAAFELLEERARRAARAARHPSIASMYRAAERSSATRASRSTRRSHHAP